MTPTVAIKGAVAFPAALLDGAEGVEVAIMEAL
jgi:hypothetical protein